MKTLNRAKSTSLGIVLLSMQRLSTGSSKNPFPLSEAGHLILAPKAGLASFPCLPNGVELPVRHTRIFHKENGAWKMVHLHVSIPVPNDEIGK